MRLDLFLKKTCVLPQRSLAKEACDAGAVRLNGRVAKPGQEVHAGDVVLVTLAHRVLELRVLEVPKGNVARRDTGRFVETLRDERRDPAARVFDAEDGAPD